MIVDSEEVKPAALKSMKKKISLLGKLSEDHLKNILSAEEKKEIIKSGIRNAIQNSTLAQTQFQLAFDKTLSTAPETKGAFLNASRKSVNTLKYVRGSISDHLEGTVKYAVDDIKEFTTHHLGLRFNYQLYLLDLMGEEGFEQSTMDLRIYGVQQVVRKFRGLSLLANPELLSTSFLAESDAISEPLTYTVETISLGYKDEYFSSVEIIRQPIEIESILIFEQAEGRSLGIVVFNGNLRWVFELENVEEAALVKVIESGTRLKEGTLVSNFKRDDGSEVLKYHGVVHRQEDFKDGSTEVKLRKVKSIEDGVRIDIKAQHFIYNIVKVNQPLKGIASLKLQIKRGLISVFKERGFLQDPLRTTEGAMKGNFFEQLAIQTPNFGNFRDYQYLYLASPLGTGRKREDLVSALEKFPLYLPIFNVYKKVFAQVIRLSKLVRNYTPETVLSAKGYVVSAKIHGKLSALLRVLQFADFNEVISDFKRWLEILAPKTLMLSFVITINIKALLDNIEANQGALSGGMFLDMTTFSNVGARELIRMISKFDISLMNPQVENSTEANYEALRAAMRAYSEEVREAGVYQLMTENRQEIDEILAIINMSEDSLVKQASEISEESERLLGEEKSIAKQSMNSGNVNDLFAHKALVSAKAEAAVKNREKKRNLEDLRVQLEALKQEELLNKTGEDIEKDAGKVAEINKKVEAITGVRTRKQRAQLEGKDIATRATSPLLGKKTARK